MLQLEAKSRVTLCAGVSESGKTTFALRYLDPVRKTRVSARVQNTGKILFPTRAWCVAFPAVNHVFSFLTGCGHTAPLFLRMRFFCGSGRQRQRLFLLQSRQHPQVVRQDLPGHRHLPMFKSFGAQGAP